MKQKSIRYAIAMIVCVALVALFCDTIKLVEAGTFIHALNILCLIFSISFAMVCAIATVVYSYLTGKGEKQ